MFNVHVNVNVSNTISLPKGLDRIKLNNKTKNNIQNRVLWRVLKLKCKTRTDTLAVASIAVFKSIMRKY